jgi:NAD(P)-dependent dehydrogenase (short-subunit alcohol dehydrogenase family)
MPLNLTHEAKTFKNKIVVVTGGARGIGKALAKAFAKHGSKVAIADTSEDLAIEVAKSFGGIGFMCDVTNEEQMEKLVSKVESIFGNIDFFISNAGVCLGESDHATSATNEVWKLSWEVNVMAHVYAARAALPQMIKNKQGHFIQIVSAAALLSQIGDAAYSTTKHAALGFAESLAITHKGDGIDVSVVCPQYIATAMLGYNEDANGNIDSELMTPEQLARIVIREIQTKKFLILPHPEVYEFMNFKSRFYDTWINKMSLLRERALKKSGTLDIKTLHKFMANSRKNVS